MKIQNPHDKFFKETFGNLEIAEDFLNNYLPEKIINIIDINTLEPQKDSFINKELEEGFSDLLFKVKINKKEGYIYFLFEHKSYISKNISLQLLKYMIEIWEAKTEKEKEELPIIIPLVIYHGKHSWNKKTTLRELITGYKELPKDIQKLIPDYEYLIYDLSAYTEEEIKGKAYLRIILTILRDIFTKDSKELLESLYRTAKYLQILEDKQTGIEFFETLMRYIFSARADLTTKDVNEVIEKIENTYPEGSEVIMTLAEAFRQEGRKEGREEGREEGVIEGLEKGELNALVKTAIKLLTKKFGAIPEELKVKISKLDVSTLEVIVNDIFEYESLEDVKRYIR